MTSTTARTASILSILLLACVTAVAESATIRGRVVSGETGAPIPFVNVGVPRAGVGTVAGEDGAFTLERVQPGATVVFSAVRHETLSVVAERLPEDGKIELTPLGLGFREEVSVKAKPPGDPDVFGRRYEGRGYGMGFGSALLGAEIGARIEIDGRTYVESAHFAIAHTGGERFLYRVNLYEFSGKTVGEKLLREDVILEAAQQRGTLTVDLRELGLVVEDDVLLSLEWIRGDRELGNENVMFRAKPRTKSNVYLKMTSQMPFTPIERHGLGFFLKGHPLD
ncbi:MAG: carboxypeptidase-like regulatory domain-containing protein [bacterium]|nr:carboxypeptidase-like regulatory domain-containing protein [bacterium]